MAKRSARRRPRKVGQPPGTLVYTGQASGASARIALFEFNEQRCDERVVQNLREAVTPPEVGTARWLDIDGFSEVSLLEQAGQLFGLHPLVLEDILNTDQRPKAEDNGDYLFVVLKMLSLHPTTKDIGIEQISLVVKQDLLITFQDQPGDVLEPVRARLRQARGRIRKLGPDYLAYSLLDAIVDNYFVVLDRLAERIEALETTVTAHPRQQAFQDIHDVKRELIFVRKAVSPLREVVSFLQRCQSSLISPDTQVYLRDLQDHIVQVVEGIDTQRDVLAALLDVYLSSVSNRTNGIMKVLALFSAIFMPLTFITGIFGMNFKYFPELEWKYGFVGVMVLMGCMAFGMLFFFRKKNWI